MPRLPVGVLALGILVGGLVVGGLTIVLNGGARSPTAATDAPAATPGSTVPNDGDRSQADVVDAPVATPGAEVPADLPTKLLIVALKRSVLEIRSAEGDKYVHRSFNPGESFVVRVGAGFTVSAEDGTAFELRLGDQSLGLLQPEGGPVFSQSIDLAVKRRQ